MTTYRERTRAQRDANDFDLRLFRLLSEAQNLADKSDDWREVARYLARARPHVRAKMHPEDREATRP